MTKPNTLKIFLEIIIFTALALAINLIFPEKLFYTNLHLNIGWVFLILFAFRRGVGPSAIAGLLYGLVSYFININSVSSVVEGLLYFGLANLVVSIAGLFARNLQRTYYNKRLSSVYLNLITGTVLAGLANFLVLLLSDVLFRADLVPNKNTTFMYFFRTGGIDFLINAGIWIVVLIVILNIQGKIFLPKDSPYISRRERSHLLND